MQAVITNLELRLEDFVRASHADVEDVDWVVPANCSSPEAFDKSFNSGVLLARDKPTSRVWVEQVKRHQGDGNGGDQGAFNGALHEQPDYMAHVRCAAGLNSLPGQWQKGHFVFHKAGCMCCYPAEVCARDTLAVLGDLNEARSR